MCQKKYILNMKFINKWVDFVNEEWSQNDPIPELRMDNNLDL